MKVVVAAIGSRGDVAPFAHLAGRLVSEGHEATLVTHESLATLAEPALPVIPVPSDPASLMAGPAAHAVRRVDPRKLNRTRDLFAQFVHSAMEPTREALAGADVLVASTFAIAAVDEAIRQAVPVVRAHMWPEYPGLGGPMPLLPYGWLVPAPARRLARGALRRVEPYLGGLDGWWERGRLHLVARHPVGLTTATAGSLYAFSPLILPSPPKAGIATGWWTAAAGPSTLSTEVSSALADGGDWIYAGFGSMHQGDPTTWLERLGAACERVGVRAVVQVGGVRGRPHPRLLCVGDEPHDELLRHVRLAVHHGGAGTTGSVVRAGVPSVVVPHLADQFYWGWRLRALGVATASNRRALASTRVLSRLIEEALAPAPAIRAARLAHRVRDEDGCGRAVRQLEGWVGGPGRGPTPRSR
ncbi:glycosyltransferase family 1 protein [Naumannella sp. ID2617S]|uniref:Uncharacterized protein n=1 Tax=Enemella dayhoffiae TaxID=2016507 RepID=A0A255H589_9ACTN|nr:glycosyltransferase [Enemella dayhoffiae]NNG20817.1 glycosyltransferase family 1 protein [Naumannella sp. ID2617S]OYO22767.1 hypothetical protein CGZ93_06865 [Enemella dayhoffiae]